MNIQVWQSALGVFIGTLPLLGAVLWNLVDVKAIKAELLQIHAELASIRERLATLEERDRWTHGPVVER